MKNDRIPYDDLKLYEEARLYDTVLIDNLQTVFPDGSEEKLADLVLQKVEKRLYTEVHRSNVAARIKRASNIAAVVLLLIILTAATLCLSVSGVRDAITDYFMEHTGYIAREFAGGKVYVYEGEYDNIGWSGDPKTSEGYRILRNKAGDEITIIKQLRESTELGDLEDALVDETIPLTDSIYGRYIEKIDADGNEVHKLYWVESDFAWRIEGTFPREEIVRIAKELC